MLQRYATRVQWAEPIGQVLVLLAVGLQLYKIEPAKNVILTGQIALTHMTTCEVMRRIDVPRQDMTDLGCYDTWENPMNAEIVRAKWLPFYATMFFIGGLLIVVGKSASIAAKSARRDAPVTPRAGE